MNPCARYSQSAGLPSRISSSNRRAPRCRDSAAKFASSFEASPFLEAVARKEEGGSRLVALRLPAMAGQQAIVAMSNQQRILDLAAVPGFSKGRIEGGIHYGHQPVNIVSGGDHSAVPGSRASGARP
jgi:hypothetical protein